MEEYRKVKGYNNYMISNEGNLKNVNWRSVGVERMVKPRKDKYGYLVVNLCENNVRKTRKIHRLVAEAFIENPDNLPMINHKDENKANNNVENLEWCDAKYNYNYGTAKERVIESKSQPIICVETGVQYKSATEASRITGVDFSRIRKCVRGLAKTSGGFHWSLLSVEQAVPSEVV